MPTTHHPIHSRTPSNRPQELPTSPQPVGAVRPTGDSAPLSSSTQLHRTALSFPGFYEPASWAPPLIPLEGPLALGTAECPKTSSACSRPPAVTSSPACQGRPSPLSPPALPLRLLSSECSSPHLQRAVPKVPLTSGFQGRALDFLPRHARPHPLSPQLAHSQRAAHSTKQTPKDTWPQPPVPPACSCSVHWQADRLDIYRPARCATVTRDRT